LAKTKVKEPVVEMGTIRLVKGYSPLRTAYNRTEHVGYGQGQN